MRKSYLMLIAALAAPLPGAAAESGEVVWVDPSCNHFIAKIGDEFGTYNWRSGSTPQKGDQMEGDLLNLEGGGREIKNATAGGANTVYIIAIGPRLYSMIHTAPAQCKKRFEGAAR